MKMIMVMNIMNLNTMIMNKMMIIIWMTFQRMTITKDKSMTKTTSF
jgi:hypothetical protein